MDDYTFETLEAPGAADHLDELIGCYTDIYDPDDPFNNPERYRVQIESHLKAPRWQAVLARDGQRDELAGYIYGFALPEGTRWWRGLTTEVSPGFTDEDGQRTVGISELMVRQAHRTHGLASELHRRFLAARPERRVTLLVEPDNEPAYSAYLSWGYNKVAELRPSWEHAPLFDVLLRDVQPA